MSRHELVFHGAGVLMPWTGQAIFLASMLAADLNGLVLWLFQGSSLPRLKKSDEDLCLSLGAFGIASAVRFGRCLGWIQQRHGSESSAHCQPLDCLCRRTASIPTAGFAKVLEGFDLNGCVRRRDLAPGF